MGHRTTAGGITVITKPGDPGPAAVGIVANKTVGNAVVRNRARRRVRAALLEARPPAGCDIVILTTTAVADVAFDELVEWLRQAMPKEDG